MTKYSRFTGMVFGGNATATGADPQIAQFGSALANTFIGTTDPETIQSLPAWGQGWIGAVTPETQFPALPEMTGVMKVMSHQICGIQQQGVSDWDNGTIYYEGNFCSKNGIIYVSTIDENQGNDPETDTTNWRNYGGANLDLSNLSSQGQNIANWSTNVTNCITEIPQNIKLELNNGTLTLKAGSKVIVPNGAGVFDEVTITSDISTTHTSTVGASFVYYRKATNDLVFSSVEGNTTGSGTTPPSSGIYYNTTTNVINYIENNVVKDTRSFPLGIVQRTGSISAIDQVFNGIGYIGSHIWVDKGVKFLSPNGRNEDGTLKSTELTTTQLRTFTRALNSTNPVWLTTESIAISSGIYYNPVTNFVELYGGVPWIGACEIGLLTDKNGVIEEFKPKLPFHAVDYNDALLKTDKEEITSWSMPSTRYTDLTLGASGSTYTAPADGYFVIKITATQDASWTTGQVTLDGNVISVAADRIRTNTPGETMLSFIAPKNSILQLNYYTNGGATLFRFIYAQGVQ